MAKDQISPVFSAAGGNFGRLEVRFLPFSAPQAKILRIWEGQEAKFFPFVVRVISKNCVKIAWKPWKSASAIRNSQFLFKNPQTQSATRNSYFKTRKRNPQLAFVCSPGANTQQIEAFWNRSRFKMVRNMRHFTVDRYSR